MQSRLDAAMADSLGAAYTQLLDLELRAFASGCKPVAAATRTALAALEDAAAVCQNQALIDKIRGGG